MRIASVKVLTMGCEWRNLLFVKVMTDEGVYGVAEARLNNRTDALAGYLEGAVKRHVLGSDPFDIEDLWLRMWRNDFGRGGDVVSSGISLIETACWDIVGKTLGQPVWRILGGKCRDRIRAYANGWYAAERTPEAFAARARLVVEKGYTALKVDPFGAGDYEMDRGEKLRSIAIIEAIRATVGDDFEIFVEMHGRFSPHTAVEIARELEPFRPGWVEEPVPPDNEDALRKAYAKIRLPVATGERLNTRWGFRRLLELQCCDIVQPDVTQCGGILELKKIAAMADAHFLPVAPHNASAPITTMASLHAGFTIPNLKIQECFDDFCEPHVLQAISGRPVVKDGWFELPMAPGLGVDIDEDVIAEHPMVDGSFNLWDPDWHRRKFRFGSDAGRPSGPGA